MRPHRLTNRCAFLSTEALFACVYACAVQPARSEAATALTCCAVVATITCERKDSVVGLVSLDECMGAGGNALYHGRCSGYVFSPFLEDRKLPLFLGCLIRQEVRDVIEGGSKLVSDFTSEQDKINRWRSAATNLDGIEAHHTRFGVYLGAHSVIPDFKRGSINAELIDVLYGPFNLGPRTI